MTPLEKFRADQAGPGFVPDLHQQLAVEQTQRLYDELLSQPPPKGGLGARVRGLFGREAREPVRGLYIWGGVGRGKTHIVNAFHDSLPFPEKLRVHFHHLMQQIHAELKTLKHERDPLSRVASRLAARTRVLCLDEFHVSDIGDAMLLARLLTGLFQHGTSLVATSNIAPRQLYLNGLQRERFLPAIALIEKHTRVVHLDGALDFRLRALESAEIYHAPLDDSANESLRRSFDGLAPEHVREAEVLQIRGRAVKTVRSADGIAWFEFAELCDTPRAADDYIEIARSYHTVLLSNVPRMNDEHNDQGTRFIKLIDELYDRNVNLIVSAQAAPDALYHGGRLEFPFRRTRSRLVEMQSRSYLAQQHLP